MNDSEKLTMLGDFHKWILHARNQYARAETDNDVVLKGYWDGKIAGLLHASQLLSKSGSEENRTILKLIEENPHEWTKRPCQTCAAVSEILGRPFGCVTKQKSRGQPSEREAKDTS